MHVQLQRCVCVFFSVHFSRLSNVCVHVLVHTLPDWSFHSSMIVMTMSKNSFSFLFAFHNHNWISILSMWRTPFATHTFLMCVCVLVDVLSPVLVSAVFFCLCCIRLHKCLSERLNRKWSLVSQHSFPGFFSVFKITQAVPNFHLSSSARFTYTVGHQKQFPSQ